MARKTKLFPPLPDAFYALGGVVVVRLVDPPDVKDDDGKPAWGTYEPATRTVLIDRHAPPRHQWWVFFHEWEHVVLNDTGQDELLTEEAVEAICNGNGHARMRERFG